MQDYDFTLLGSMQEQDAVVGILKPLRAKAPERIVMIVLTEDMTENRRRAKLQQARTELAKGDVVAFAGQQAPRLEFADKARNDVKASVQLPAFVDQTIQILAEQTERPLITLDCHNRESFWAALKVMGAQSADLFAIAELGALKPDARKQGVGKPIGEAHLLCADLMQARGLKINADYKLGDFINMVRRSTKVKLPTIDLDDQILASHYLRDLEMSTGARKELSTIDRLVKITSALRYIGREKPEVVMLSQKEWAGIEKIQNIMRDMDGDVHDESYTRRFSDVPRMLVLRGDPREVLSRKYKEHYQFDAEQFNFDQLLQFHDGYGGEELRFRGGIHANPFPLTLFETEMTCEVPAKHVLTVATLVMQEADTLTAYNFIKPVGLPNASYYLHPHKMMVSLEQGRANNVAIIDQNTDKTLYSGGRLSLNNMGDMAFMHTLSAIARMNEPDFAQTMYETRRRGLVDVAKGKFPYFDYVGIDSFGPTTSFMRIGPKGEAQEVESKRRHLVRGHPRRLRDDNDEVREIIIIPPHMRGDESKGFVTKGYNLDK